MTQMPDQYYQRFDPAKNYEEHLFLANRPLQSAEFNELQKHAAYRLRTIADALFKDGDVIRDAQVTVDKDTGSVTCESGAVYISGAVRGVPSANFTIPVSGTVAIGVRLIESVITSVEDPELLDPAAGTRAYNEAGASRLKVESVWGWEGDTGAGEFFPVYTVIDGILSAKEAPPNLDVVTQALARYDRDSAGGTYVVSGLNVSRLADDNEGNQVYSIAEGRARAFGYGIELPTARRVVHSALADLKTINNEPKTSSTIGAQRVNLARTPVKDILSVSITAEKTTNLTHGIFTGAQDPLPDTSVLEILSVTQGATTYIAGNDYLLTDGKVDWTPAGNEPAPGSTYTVSYRYITLTTPTDVDETGYTVTGAVAGTLILTTYRQMLPRVDRLCINADGDLIWLIGVSAEFNPQPPAIPENLLLLASVYQYWNSQTQVVNDSVRVVSMPVLADIDNRIDLAMQLIAQQRLESSIHTREAGAKKGLFTDPFIDNSQRDAGTVQTAAIVGGMLMLPIEASIGQVSNDIDMPAACAYTHTVALSQAFRTGDMKINPYMVFDLVPATVTLRPAVDRWTQVQTTWATPTTSRFVVNRTSSFSNARAVSTSTSRRNVMLSSSTTEIETLRQITVQFSISGFGSNEALQQVTFDGVDVTPPGLSADANGNLSGSFTIPPNIPSGNKEVVFTGAGGMMGSAIFSGQGTLERQVWQQQTRVTTTRWVSPPPPPRPPPRRYIDPLAQTFRMEEATQCSGVDLWFSIKPTTQSRVQIRETTVGFPNQTIVAESILVPAQINVGGLSTQVLFDSPILLQGGVEYALVVLCNDAVGALSIAQLGKFDAAAQRWITAQPYTVGVMLSSSNAVSWSVHQDRDLSFRILRAQYSQSSRTIDLGSVAVTDATDLMLMGFAERPVSDANIEYILTLPNESTITVSDGQPIELAAAITGNVQISAQLTMQNELSPILWPGTQLVSGTIASTGDYVTRAIPAGAGSTVKAIFEAIVPNGANVEAYYKGTDVGDTWASLPVIATASVDDGYVEFVCEAASVDEAMVQVKLVLSGTPAARPYVRDLRVIIT
nr:DUF4815 domain-containing protein [Nitrosomonas nitrosa]